LNAEDTIVRDAPPRSHTGFVLTNLKRVLFALALAAAMAGCRAGAGRAGDLNIALAIFPSEAARYGEFVADFARQHNIRVNIIAQTYGDILQAMRVQAGAGGTLDLVELDLAMLGEARSSAQDLTPLVSPSARALFSPAAWDAATFDGRIYFVPHRLMWQAMIYNHIKVPNPPRTWDELRRFARAHPGKLALKGARYEGAICDVMPFVWSAGGDECEPGGGGALSALAFLRVLAPDLNAESAVFREMSVLEAQARGSVWIHYNWPFAIAYLHAKGLAPQVDLSAPIPAGSDGRATPLGGGYLAIARGAPHPQLAADFIRYLLTRRAQIKLSRDLGWYGSIAPPPGSEDAALYAGFIAMRPYVRARPAVACYTQLSNCWRRAIRAVLFAGEPPAEAVASVFPAAAQPASTGQARNFCSCAGGSL
jgi:ABC-type glycerol-3-phosphate transport system substrate-binding protein